MKECSGTQGVIFEIMTESHIAAAYTNQIFKNVLKSEQPQQEYSFITNTKVISPAQLEHGVLGATAISLDSQWTSLMQA